MYTSYYKLHGKPFQVSPDHNFIYLSSGHKRAMSYLRYGISQGEGFIIITGDIGTGKTTLVKNLFAELDTRNIIPVQIVTTQLEPLDLLRTIATGLDLPTQGLDKAALISKIHWFLTKAHTQNKRVLLVIDEAQNLPLRSVEELRMLSNFQYEDKPLLQCFLLAQKEFRITLQSARLEQLRQRVIASCDLVALNATETKQYIEHRLKLVGWDNNPYFTDDAFAAIFKFTCGVPRRINVFCDRLLLYGFLEEVNDFTDEHVKQVAKELSNEVGNPLVVVSDESGRGLDDYNPNDKQDIGSRLLALEDAQTEIAKAMLKHSEFLKMLSEQLGNKQGPKMVVSEKDSEYIELGLN